MVKIKRLKSDFTGGRVSALAHIGSHLKNFSKSLKTLHNRTILPTGGTTRRLGTLFSHEVYNHARDSRLIEFKFNEEIVYGVELAQDKIRFFNTNGIIKEAAKTITGITNANPAVVTSAAHGYSNGDHVYITGVVGMDINSPLLRYTVANVTTNTFELAGINSTSLGTYTSGGEARKIYGIGSPYSEGDLFEIQYTQVGNVITLVHPDYAPRELARISETNWVLTPLMKDTSSPAASIVLDKGPYLKENTTTTTLDPSGTSGSVTVVASSTTGINGGAGFLSTDIGRLIRWKDGDWFDLEITAVGSTTSVTATILRSGTMSGHTATTSWRLGAFSRTTGFPACVTHHQLRRYYASTRNATYGNPESIYGSDTDDFSNFTPGDAVDFIINSDEVNIINWLSSANDGLRIGAIGSIWTLNSGDTNTSISSTAIDAVYETGDNTSYSRPIKTTSSLLFLNRTGTKLKELAYNSAIDGYSAPDLTILSEDVLTSEDNSGIMQTAYQADNISTVWCVKGDGTLAALTYLRGEGVVGWHTHELGGTSASVKSICSLTDSTQDVLWFVVKRTIDGVTKRYVERMDVDFKNREVIDAVFTDSSLRVTAESPAFNLTFSSLAEGTGRTVTSSGALFTTGDVGRIIKYGDSKAVITGYTDSTHVTVDVVITFSANPTSGSWTFSTNIIDGLDYLEGETVSILTDSSNQQTDVVVNNGMVELDAQYNEATVGLPYESILETLRLDIIQETGEVVLGARSKITKAIIYFFETNSGSIGSDNSNLVELEFKTGQDLTDQTIPLFTGAYDILPFIGFKDDITIMLKDSTNLPSTIVGLLIEVLVNDD